MTKEQKKLICRIQTLLYMVETELEDNDPINATIAIETAKDEMDRLKYTLRGKKNNYHTELLKTLKQAGTFQHIPMRETLDILPDPKVTVQDMYDYGYYGAGVFPISTRNAKILLSANCEILGLTEDRNEFVVEDMDDLELLDSEGFMFGIIEEEWYEYLQNNPDINVLLSLWDNGSE